MATNSTALVIPPPAETAAEAIETALRDIKAPVEIPDYWFWLWLALATIALTAMALALWKFWLKKKFEPAPIPPLPPHVRARRKLNEALALINEPKPFTIVVADTIRVYLEESFQFHAPERTTEEFLYELQSTRLLTQDQKATLADFLSRCDLVKFAKYEPTQVELEDLHSAAMRIIEETEPRPAVLDGRGSSPAAATA